MIVEENFGRKLIEIYVEHFDESGGGIFDSVHKRGLIRYIREGRRICSSSEALVKHIGI